MLELSRLVRTRIGSPVKLLPTALVSSASRPSITRKAPKVKPVKIDLRNGLTVIGFAKDGVGALLTTKCGACHAWTGSARSAKPFANSSLARIVSGQMPQGGAKLPESEIGLVRAWIATGMNE